MSSGRIITFYPGKGGTGRSMALANVAWILPARAGEVLMVDWDLEAPGLHLYVHPFLADKSLVASEGVIDLVLEVRGRRDPAEVSPEAKLGRIRVVRTTLAGTGHSPISPNIAFHFAWSFPEGGTLDLLPAGKQDQIYPARVNSFNWASFYDRLGGGVFLEAVER